VEPAERLYLLVQHLGRRLRRLDQDLGLSPARFSVLVLLATHQPMTPAQLARSEGVRPPSMTRLIRDLERDGLVSSSSVADDARLRMVSITETGRSLVLGARKAKIDLVRFHLERESLTGRDLEVLGRLDEAFDQD
jgi:DNA-binding MarR family transcriptional regulator